MTTKLFLALVLALPAAAEPPAAVDVLKGALEPPSTGFSGRLMVTRWFGRQTRAEEARIFFSPPDRYRWEFLRPDGSVKRVVVSDGDKEKVYLIKQRRILVGDAAKSLEKVMPEERELELLLKNYRLSAPEEDAIAGRKVWRIELVPLEPGKAHQRLWVDQETRVILEVKKFHPHGTGSNAAVSRFNRFEPGASAPEGLFSLEGDSTTVVENHGLDPDFLSREDLIKAAGRPLEVPEELPGGFSFESGNSLDVRGNAVLHLRYTDGLAVLSVFRTDRPVRLPEGGRLEVADSGPSKSLRLSGSGKVLKRKAGRHYYTLIGDLPALLLEKIARGLN